MATRNAPAPKSVQDKVTMVSKGARITDAILAVVFLGLAVFWGGWFWWASSAFCAATAIIGPIDHMYAWVRDRFLQVKQGK